MYELPAWHEAFAFTHGRQSINPSPVMFANVYGTYLADQAVRSRLIGVSSYSEGLAADLNMCIMLALASHNCTVTQAVTLYASFFFGASSATNVTQLMLLLEQSWSGDVYNNSAITLAYDLATATLQPNLGWRAQMYLYRATFDAAVRHRVDFDTDIKAYGLSALSDWPQAGPDWCIINFMGALEIEDPAQSDLDALISDLHELRKALNASIGLTVLQSQQPTLSLEDISSTAISDNAFLHAAANAALDKPKAAQVAFISFVLNHTHCPSVPCNYDWLGGMHAQDHPHLVPGPGPLADPDFYNSPLRSFTNQPERQVSALPGRWRVYAEIFYDNRLVMSYPSSSLKVGVDHTLVVVRIHAHLTGSCSPLFTVCPGIFQHSYRQHCVLLHEQAPAQQRH
jgi:hypothetical protein